MCIVWAFGVTFYLRSGPDHVRILGNSNSWKFSFQCHSRYSKYYEVKMTCGNRSNLILIFVIFVVTFMGGSCCATQQAIDYWWISQLCCDTVPWHIPSASRIRCEFCHIESCAATYCATSIRVILSSLPHGMSFHSTPKSPAFPSGSIRDLVLGLQSIM
jgi:hypothetical protein